MSAGDPERGLEQELRELRAVNELIRTLTSTLELPEILRIMLDRLKSLTRAEGLSLLLHDAERDELVFAATETLQENVVVGMRVPPSRSIASWVARTGDSVIVDDVRNDPRFYAEIDRVTRFQTRSVLAVPIKRGGAVVGVLQAVNRYGETPFSERDQHALEAFAEEVSEHCVADRLAIDARGMQRLLARQVMAVPSEAASLLLLDPAGRELVFRASRSVQPGVIEGLRLPCDRGISGWVARHREAVRLDDVTNDPRYFAGFEPQTQLVPRTMMCVPMISKETLRGVIQIINKVDGTSFTDAELHLAQRLADHAAIAIENASLYRQAYLASITDDLTGLGNTRHFNRRLPELVAAGSVALILLDLDAFKAVVDHYGHLVGSRTIAQVGRIVAKLLRPGDLAPRFGGDEFVIALPNTDSSQAAIIAEKIRAAIAACDRLDGEDVDLSGVTASVGVAAYPEHAADAETLFRAADAAMYEVKRSSKNRVALAA
jgi:diguanylate cyclase (GGDEF)-like protein